jgi:GntR family transcriptional regulator
MLLNVRPDSPVPIYEQIVSQVVFAVAAGDLIEGDLVPSVRDLAQQLIVNPNTVLRAFQELERLGILESKRGLGMALTARAREVCSDRRREIVRLRVREALREAASAGLSTDEVHDMVDREWQSLVGS